MVADYTAKQEVDLASGGAFSIGPEPAANGSAGLAKCFRAGRTHRVGVDAGLWRGIQREGEPDWSEPFFWPMAGLSYDAVYD